MRILDGLGTCVNRYLAEHYRLSTGSGTLPAIRQCGGCPDCRAHERPPVAARQPAQPMSDGALAVPPGHALRSLAPQGRLCVWTDGPQPATERELTDAWSATASWPWWPRARGRRRRARRGPPGGRTRSRTGSTPQTTWRPHAGAGGPWGNQPTGGHC